MNNNIIAPLTIDERSGMANSETSTLSLKVEEMPAVKHTAISFHDINYTVQIPKSFCGACRSKESKRILNDVSGLMKPGLNAIMGPTGSGKSSLLDILAGRKDPSGLTGQVLIDGMPLPKNFKRISGYVVQQDIVLGTLTVRENLWFSANLRLPRSVSRETKSKRIDEILFDLGLTTCANTKVGNEMIRGISGGEKKRASIAIELITAPTVLFLDEPTTGLDASTANAVMILLKRMGRKGRTIILSIHQPRYSIFRLFDSLTLLSLGRLAYHGSNEDVLSYFESLDNLDEEREEKNANVAVKLSESFAKSEIFILSQRELSAISEKFNEKKRRSADYDDYATPFYYQFGILSKRAFRNVIRNPIASVGSLVINIIVGVIFGLLYYQVDDSPSTGTQNRFGVLFFIVTNLMFSSISAIEVFSKEKDVFIHEYVSGYYRVISYFLSKLVADLIPMRTISPIIFGSVTYWMVGLKADVGAFFIFVLFLILVGYSATAIALFFSATFGNFAVASIFITLIFVFSILFAGLLLNIDTVLPWLAWIKYLSLAQYGFSGLSVNEFRYSNFTSCVTPGDAAAATSLLQVANSPSTHVDVIGNITCYTVTGEGFVFERIGIGSNGVLSDWDLWRNVVALSAITLGMLVLTYVQLMRTKTLT